MTHNDPLRTVSKTGKVYEYDRTAYEPTVSVKRLEWMEKYSRMSHGELIEARTKTADVNELKIIAFYVRKA